MTDADFLSDPVLGKLWDALPSARVIGGAVRDYLARRPVADIDLATPDAPAAVTAALESACIKVVPTGLTHGTVTAVLDGRGYEITTLRRDLETDGRHAVVAFTTDWQRDAARRDFTINAMSIARDGKLFDYFGGAADLKDGRVRFVGDAATRIAEDYLRILRFFRFYARYGLVVPDEATLRALKAGAAGIPQLSIERVWHELRLILNTTDPQPAVTLMADLGIWPAIMPEAAAIARLSGLPADPVLRIAGMLTGDALALATRLKMSNEDRDRLLRLVATPRPEGSDADLRRLLADNLPADLIDKARLERLDDAHDRLSHMERPVFPLEGRDVVALKVPAGPGVGQLLRETRQWWLTGGCVADRSACLTELARLAHLPNMDGKR